MLWKRRQAVRHLFHVEHKSSGAKCIHRVPHDNVFLLTPLAKWRDDIIIIMSLCCPTAGQRPPYPLSTSVGLELWMGQSFVCVCQDRPDISFFVSRDVVFCFLGNRNNWCDSESWMLKWDWAGHVSHMSEYLFAKITAKHKKIYVSWYVWY